MLSRTILSYSSPNDSSNSRLLNRLQPLSPRQKSQLLWNQANPASFSKTPGVGYPLTSRPCGISSLQPLLSRPSYNLVNAILAEPLHLPSPPRPLCSDLSALCVKPFLAFARRQAPLTPFRINTCKSVSKQTTLTSFRITTYEKQGEGVHHHLRVLCAPTSVPSVLSPILPLPTFQIVRCTNIAEWRKIGFRAALRRVQSTQPAGKGLSQTEWHSVQDQRMTS